MLFALACMLSPPQVLKPTARDCAYSPALLTIAQTAHSDISVVEDCLEQAVRSANDTEEREGALLAGGTLFALRAFTKADELGLPDLDTLSGQRARWYTQTSAGAVAHFRRVVLPNVHRLSQMSAHCAKELRTEVNLFLRFSDLLRAALHERHLAVSPLLSILRFLTFRYQRVSSELDMELLRHDPSYQGMHLRAMARTIQTSDLATAFSLARRCQFPLWMVSFHLLLLRRLIINRLPSNASSSWQRNHLATPR
jgi:hypothetical protein